MSQSLVDRALALSGSLDDLKHPQCCPNCFRTVTLGLYPSDKGHSRLLEELRDKHPQFWNSCLSFVTAPRTADDLPALRAQLLKNVRACSHPHTQRDDFVLDDPAHVLVDAIYVALKACLASGKHPMVNRRTAPKGFGTKHGRWPEGPAKLFPIGEQHTVEMHMFWSTMRISVSPLAMLGCTLLVARPYVLPHLVRPGQMRAQLVYLLAQMLHRDLLHPPEGWEGDAPIPLAQTASDSRLPLVHQELHAALVDTAVSFLRALIDGVEGGMSDFAPFFFGYQRVMFHAMQAASRALGTSSPDFLCLSRFLNLMITVYKVSLPVDARVSASWPKETRANADPMGMAQVTLLNLSQLARRRACSAAGCGKTVHENGGRAFAICSRCKVVCYCGRECQQRDWKARQYPHKDVCPLVCRLLSQTSLSASTEDFVEAFERALERDDQLAIYKWSASGGGLYSPSTARALEQINAQLPAGGLASLPTDIQKAILGGRQEMSNSPEAVQKLFEALTMRTP